MFSLRPRSQELYGCEELEHSGAGKNQKNDVFKFLGFQVKDWTEYSSFDERISKKNSDKWQGLNIDKEIDFIRRGL